MGLRSRIRDTAVSVAAFGLSNLCLGTCVKTPNSNSNNLQQEENGRVTSVESSKYPGFISTQSEVSGDWIPSGLDSLREKSREETFVCLTTDNEDSYTHTKVLESIEDAKNTILEYPINQLFEKYGKSKLPHPLKVSGVSPRFRSLLGNGGIEAADTPQKLNPREGGVTSETLYEIGDTLSFRLIDSRLEGIFSEYLSEQLKKPGFETFFDKDSLSVQKGPDEKSDNFRRDSEKKSEFLRINESKLNDENHIYDTVVMSVPGGKSALSLYRDGKLFMAIYASIGTSGRKTRMGQFEIIGKNPYKRSIKYNNSAMPLALNYDGGFYFHQGNVTGKPLSHGCVRLPGVYADVLYSLVKDKEHVDVFIDKNLYEYK